LPKRKWLCLLLILVLLEAELVCAQEAPKPEPPSVSAAASQICRTHEKNLWPEYRFWDKENRWLFAGVGAARVLDYSSTLNMRRRGRQEVFLSNVVVDNHPAFATIEAATTGASVDASYLFHRCGHHKLERWTSFVHLGLTTIGALRNYCLKTAHPKTTP
jgi:hypothetical protein